MRTDVHTAPEIATHLSKAFGGTAKHWYQMQTNRDEAITKALSVGHEGGSR